jgi:hypothetical protein
VNFFGQVGPAKDTKDTQGRQANPKAEGRNPKEVRNPNSEHGNARMLAPIHVQGIQNVRICQKKSKKSGFLRMVEFVDIFAG